MTAITQIAGRKGKNQEYQNKENNGQKQLDKREDNKKLKNTEEELNLVLLAMLRDYITLNSEIMQRNFILQSKKIVDLFKGKKN